MTFAATRCVSCE